MLTCFFPRVSFWIAWLDDDDVRRLCICVLRAERTNVQITIQMEANTRPGRTMLRGYQGQLGQCTSRCQDASEQRLATFSTLSEISIFMALRRVLGEFYGEVSHMNANLELLARFFEKNPSYANKAFLAVKVRMSSYTVRQTLTLDVIRREEQRLTVTPLIARMYSFSFNNFSMVAVH